MTTKQENIHFPGVENLWETKGLFSDHYLRSRLKESDLWPDREEVKPFWEYCKNLWEKKRIGLGRGKEALTEQELLEPVMTKLGFTFLPKTSIPGERKEPDYLLFVDEAAKDSVFEKSTLDQYSAALTVMEAKKVNKNLGKASEVETPGKFPHHQIRDYLQDAIDDRGESYFDWAILTNGNLWRLYSRHVSSSSYFEFDFAKAVEHLDDFCFFIALFSPKALIRDTDGKCRLDYLREEALQVQTELEDDLRKRVYTLLEELANGFFTWEENNIAEDDLPQLYENSLIYLYRLLFVLYCEGRGLLPVKPSGPGANKNYRERYCLVRLQSRVRNPEVSFDKNLTDLYEQLLGLFSLINGDKPSRNKACDVPRYNGGLFSHREFPKIDEWRMDEVTLARVLRGLMYSEMPTSVGRQSSFDFGETIDYADLEVRQLGSIYEGLLEHHLELEDGRVVLKGDKAERKATGTYYTPDYIVQYIVEKTLQPLCHRIDDLSHVSEAKHDGKQDNSFAKEVLKLNVLDPAMGSGHFLVRATEYLADEIVYHPTTVLQIGEVKRGFSHEEAEFAYWRRRVVESCIYGVDLNPLAVELSKLSLWLTCIAVDQPLSFLDHHFRTGNSLIGAKLSELGQLPEKKKTKQIPFPFGPDLPKAVSDAIATLEDIESTESKKVEDIKEKEKRWKVEVHGRLAPYRSVGDLWLSTFFGLKIKEPDYNHFAKLLVSSPKPRTKEARQIRKELRSITPVLLEARKNRFFHWELEFPEVFFEVDGSHKVNYGFDVIIGNPPYGVKLTDSERTYLSRKFDIGSTDTAALMMINSYVINRMGGYVSFIVPKSFTYASNWEITRQSLINDLVFIVDCSRVWKEVKYEMVIFGCNKGTDISSYLSSVRFDNKIYPTGDISKSLCNEFGFIVNGVTQQAIDVGLKMKRKCSPLNDFVKNKRGAMYQKYVSSEGDKVVIGGKQIGRYHPILGEKGRIKSEILEDSKAFIKPNSILVQRIVAHVRKPHPRIIIIANVSEEVDPNNVIIVDTINQLDNISGYSSKFLLGFLNSELLSWYCYRFIFANAIRTMQFDNPTTSKIPIPVIDLSNSSDKSSHDRMVELVDRMLRLHKQLAEAQMESERRPIEDEIEATDREIDALVYELYELTEEEVRIVEGSFS